MKTQNKKNTDSQNGNNLVFNKLELYILPSSENQKEQKLFLGSCYCTIEGETITIEAVKQKKDHE